MKERTDAERLDWLHRKSSYGQGWVCRLSTTGRGWRVHETSKGDASPTIHEAIDAAMDAEETNP